ncbi:MAG: heavy metal translocating P-type ATPase metal-binding domain-containing protein [Terrimicrobiaceae bacterium]
MKTRLTKPAADTPAAPSSQSCIHCHTSFRATAQEAEFCCSGCRFVYHLLHKRGLQDFYQFGEVFTPVGSQVFHERTLDWLRDLQKEAHGEAPVSELTLRVQGISCAGCVWLLEAIFAEQPGAVSCRVNSSAGTILLRWEPGACDLLAYARDVQRFGYLLGPGGEEKIPTKPLVRRLGICGALALNVMLFSLPRYLGLDPSDQFANLFDGVALLIATASLLIGGPYFFRRAWAALRRGDLHIDLPISLGLLCAYTGSVVAWRTGSSAFAYFDFVAIFTFLMLLGRWLQERSVENNRQRLLGMRLSPGSVDVLRHGLEVQAPAESLEAGERFAVGRNGLVPVRAKLLLAPAVFALNWINGEPAPRTFPAGGFVPSGARCLSSDTCQFLALESWGSSQLARLLTFEESEPWRNLALQKLIRIYLACVLVLAAAGFVAWGLLGGDWLAAAQVLVSVLVVSCPCAIGVALPLLDDVAAARLQQVGVFVREGSLWSRLKQVRTILFDKTGTLTLENLGLANPEALGALSPTAKSTLLTLVHTSLHPVAACIREALLTGGIEPEEAGLSRVREIIGMGLEWNSAAGLWRLGRSPWAGQSDLGGGTVFSLEGVSLATFRFAEDLRPEAANQVGQFAAQGFDLFLLSGDEPHKVSALAKNLGLPPDRGLGGLTPQEKARLIQTRWKDSALILGDGANDSLAFDAALCRGTPAVDTGLLEHKADFYLLGRSLAGLGHLFALARTHRFATRAVFAFALTYNALAVGASLSGWMIPLVAAVIMPLSSLTSIGIVFLVLRGTSSEHLSQPSHIQKS